MFKKSWRGEEKIGTCEREKKSEKIHNTFSNNFYWWNDDEIEKRKNPSYLIADIKRSVEEKKL